MSHVSNQLLDLLPRRDRVRLISVSESVDLELGEVICESGRDIRFVYFPTRAFVSLITPIDATPVLEVGLVGQEGMIGIPLLLGVKEAPFQGLVQGAGSAWRLSTLEFGRELGRSEALRQCLKRYLYVMLVQLASTAACTHFHLIGQRLARWLLMTHDRAGADQFHVTHEFLAYMLGVRRVGVTNAAHELQRLGSITYRRGEVTVRDRAGLEAAACGCYAANRLTYASVMRVRRARGPRSSW
jgi:CRP-like cAMP-binding protein